MARWRKEVEWFADQMERKLRANDHKGGWKEETPSYLLDRIHEELRELQAIGMWSMEACALRAMERPDIPTHRGPRAQDIVDEAADVANMVMMLADVCARPVLATPPAPPAAKPCATCGGKGFQTSWMWDGGGTKRRDVCAPCPACSPAAEEGKR